ncbi:extracellular solute-binding protein [Kribbella sandramycini]|uniref:ABC-type glycerol-3-phosphate transport system substrate-binding protein n=1 Tax=Kribbella sandramycini TaxID=60450 RepID=A0A7Y4L309_9ACTN|nr:extracellular solute-binding protein [Kribbella sandramycini]MBB6571143.1 ABC-type glycerol-3-phosphate transport system substrate-binding protein [Kribbella sandramycini]NOL43449.1 extracellular solute-binding protein [Kribbella sandramycini]
MAVRNITNRLVASALGAALLLTGCGLGSGAAPEQADTSGEVKGAITFQTVQLSPTFDDYLKGVIAAFEKAYPGTKVEWTDIPSDAAARKVSADSVTGKLPDVMDLDTVTLAPLGRRELVVDMAAAASDVKSNYVPSAWDSFAFTGSAIAALPWYLNTPVLMSNQSLLKKAGLDSQPAPASYDELFERAARIAEKAKVAGYQPTETGLTSALLTVGVPLVNGDSTQAVVNTPDAQKFVTKLAELYKSGGIPQDSVTAKERSEIETFSDGKTAYLEAGGSRLKIIKQNSPAVYGEVAIGKPLGDATKRTWVVAHGLAVPKKSGNVATAVAFAKFLSAAENQLALGKQSSVFPSTLASLNDPFFTTGDDKDLTVAARKIAAASLHDGRTMVKPAAADSEYAATLWSAVQPAILGKTSPADALADAETKLTKILKDRRQ